MAPIVMTITETLTGTNVNMDAIGAVAIQVVGNHFTFSFDIHCATTCQGIALWLQNLTNFLCNLLGTSSNVKLPFSMP